MNTTISTQLDSILCDDCNKVPFTTVYFFGHKRCNSCAEIFNAEIYKKRLAKEEDERASMAAHVCEDDDDFCEECCQHDEHDHGICLDCGKDNTDHFIGMAESYYEGER